MKTLKDLKKDILISPRDSAFDNSFFDGVNELEQELRAEAIKWAVGCCLALEHPAFKMWMKFFDITEEELQKEIDNIDN
jgi:hypothetical protein